MEQQSPQKHKNWLTALIIIGATFMVGAVGCLLGGKMKEGYQNPPAFPPYWVFPVVWSVLYIAMGVAAYLAYLDNRNPARRRNDFIVYGVHLFFNLLWPLFFFRLGWLWFSCVWLALNIVSAVIVAVRFYKSQMAAGIIFMVYIVWLVYALYLNIGVTVLNF